MTLCDAGEQTTAGVARLVCRAFHGPRPEGCICAHHNGNRTDDRAENLRWATVSENEADKRRHGTHIRGERHPGAKLRAVDVEAIRALAATERFHWTQIAALFSVSDGLIHKIVRGEAWEEIARA